MPLYVCQHCEKPFDGGAQFNDHDCVKNARKKGLEQLSRELGIDIHGRPLPNGGQK